jgi:hypothetical protein
MIDEDLVAFVLIVVTILGAIMLVICACYYTIVIAMRGDGEERTGLKAEAHLEEGSMSFRVYTADTHPTGAPFQAVSVKRKSSEGYSKGVSSGRSTPNPIEDGTL